jgi:hypothetical protein
VPLGQNHARPRCTVRRGPRPRGARPVCTALAWPSSAGPRNARRRRYTATALLSESTVARRRRTGDSGEWRLTSTETAARRDGDERAASGTRRSGRHGGGPGGTASDRGSVGTAARQARQSGRRRRAGGGRRERGGLLGQRGAWQPRGNGALPRGPGAVRGV